MAIDRLAPGERLHDGPPSTPRPAAAVILLRERRRADRSEVQVLLAQRTPRARFMGGAWVFPGGALEPGDGAEQDGLRHAARRELAEEVGIRLESGAELVAFSRWVTPRRIRTRFDAWFYLARAPSSSEPHSDGAEIVAARWLTPQLALDEQAAGRLLLAFPTIKLLERLSGGASAAALLRAAAETRVEPVTPRIVGRGPNARIVLPGEPGYA